MGQAQSYGMGIIWELEPRQVRPQLRNITKTLIAFFLYLGLLVLLLSTPGCATPGTQAERNGWWFDDQAVIYSEGDPNAIFGPQR